MTAHVQAVAQVEPIDATRPQIVLFLGRKGSGKSVAARQLFTDWPTDKVVADPTGDADPGPDAEKVYPPFDAQMPAPRDDGRPHVIHAVIDAGDPAFREHLDQAARFALYPKTRPGLIWYDEFGLNSGANDVGPNMTRLLMTSRHQQSSALLCNPRALNIPVLALHQADYVYLFDLPQEADRKRVAENMGSWTVRELSDEMDEMRRRGPYWHLRYDVRADKMTRCPPLPYVPTENAKPS